MEKKIVTQFELGKWYKRKSDGAKFEFVIADGTPPELCFSNRLGDILFFHAPGTDHFDPEPVDPPADAVTVVLVKPETDLEIVARAMGARFNWFNPHYGDTHVRVEFSQMKTLAKTLRSLGF